MVAIGGAAIGIALSLLPTKFGLLLAGFVILSIVVGGVLYSMRT